MEHGVRQRAMQSAAPHRPSVRFDGVHGRIVEGLVDTAMPFQADVAW